MKSHPSGKPIRQDRVIGRPVWRVPDKGPVTPRLRDQPNIQAIGFMAQLTAREDDE